jgi:hypothetical protein
MLELLKKCFGKRPPREFLHPSLGLFRGDGYFWHVEVPARKDLTLFVRGDKRGPYASLTEEACRVIDRLSELESAALLFAAAQERDLCGREVSLRPSELKLAGIGFHNRDRPDWFGLQFVLHPDDKDVWEVSFERYEPTELEFH